MRLFCGLAVLLLASCHQHDSSPKAAAEPPLLRPVANPQPVNKAVLDAEGVTFDTPRGKTQEFEFGAPREQVDAMAKRMFGAPDALSANQECGAGPMEFSRYGPLTVNFQDGKLVGWFAREGSEVVTSDGIHPGTLMRDLKVARSARMIAGSTLDGEFDYLAADGHTIGGFATGEGRDAKIESLYAGVNCFFR